MIGNKIIKLESIDSTNIYMKNLLKQSKLEEGTAVITKQQSEGRGQLNNRWESVPDKNILMSYVLFPTFLDASSQFNISKCVALGIAGFMQNYLEGISIKWPNDILVNNRKIAGILIENSLRTNIITSTVVGVGINVNQVDFGKFVVNATSFKTETGQDFIIEELLPKLFESLSFWYGQLQSGIFDSIDNEYIAHLYQYNKFCKYSDDKGHFNAKITGIDNFGRLCLIDDKKMKRKYAFKEIVFH